jgi:sec-independent protein translocase protein TatC
MAKKEQKEMSFLDHLEELRWMLVRSSIAILVFTILSLFISDFILNQIIFGPTEPDFVTYRFFCKVTQAFGMEDAEICNATMPFKIQNTDMSGQISFWIWTSFTFGIILGFPFVLWQIWKFIKPALYEQEKKLAIPFILTSSGLFFLGVLFGYFIITPLSVYFFGNFQASTKIINEFNLDSYTGMVKTSVLACGIVFELPIIIYFLSKLGLVTPDFLRKSRKYALILVLLLSAIITPPDVISQIIVAIPIMILYEISILISVLVVKKEAKNKLIKT